MKNRALFLSILVCVACGCIMLWLFQAKDFSSGSTFNLLLHESIRKRSAAEVDMNGNNVLTKDDAVKALEFIAANSNFESYLLLMYLKRNYSKDYQLLDNKIRIKILVSGLEHTQYLNDWGHMAEDEEYTGEAGRALLECGVDAIPFLEPILTDDRPANLFGSEEATASVSYHYRRKDFAYVYLGKIIGSKYSFERTPAERDASIERLKMGLDAAKRLDSAIAR